MTAWGSDHTGANYEGIIHRRHRYHQYRDRETASGGSRLGSLGHQPREQERFAAADVESLKSGDKVRLNGNTYTVSSLARPWWKNTETEYEIIPQETLPDGSWIGFEKGEGDFYYGIIDNYRTTSFLTDVPIWMPLPYAFSFVYTVNENDVTIFDADKFVEFVKEGSDFVDDLGPESTVVQFSEGLLTMIATQER